MTNFEELKQVTTLALSHSHTNRGFLCLVHCSGTVILLTEDLKKQHMKYEN
jgi:hypothetical protein